MIIIGITGTLGAGKGSIVEYLTQNKGFKHFSARDYISQEVSRRNLVLNRDSLTLVANDLRQKHSPSFIIDQLYQMAIAEGKNAVIESVRTLGEIRSLRKNAHFYLFAVDAPAEVRYQRISQRASETDHINYPTFLANEEREMKASDPNKQNLSACIAEADYRFDNSGDINQLYKQVENVLNKLNL